MSEIDRRAFLILTGQSAALLGLGLPGIARADSLEIPVSASGDNEWEFYHPGVYNVQDSKLMRALQEYLAAINKNNANVNVQDLIAGKLENQSGIERPAAVTGKYMETIYERYGNRNQLFHDKAYASKTKYGRVIAFPLILQPEVWPGTEGKPEGMADYMLVNGINCTNNYYKPFYEGDTLFQVNANQRCVDITPAAGSHYRTLALSGTCKTYNQKGELVSESACMLKESYRRHKDPAKRNPSGKRAWESPDWWQRKPHQYTDKDWETIIAFWKAEVYRGEEPLYWDDVNVGDQPAPRVAGPFLADEAGVDMLFNSPGWSSNIKYNVLTPEIFAKMVKNQQGIWVPAEYQEKKPKGQGSGGNMDRLEAAISSAGPQGPGGPGGPPPGQQGKQVPETSEIANRDGRAVIQNAVCAKWVAGMLINWIGDQGWLQRIGWDIMSLPPGYPESVVPPITKEMMPAQFDRFPYMDKVPFMRGCRAAWHALEGDAILCHAYVTDKYANDGEYFVNLSWWCQTLDQYIVEEGSATVKLPKRA